jgi:hypothetical protein
LQDTITAVLTLTWQLSYDDMMHISWYRCLSLPAAVSVVPVCQSRGRPGILSC